MGKDSVGGFVVAVSSGVVMQPGDDGKITDKSNHAGKTLSGQDYGSMLMKPRRCLLPCETRYQ